MAVDGEPAGAWPEEMGGVSFYAESSMSIPGKGEPGPGCGEWHVREFCDTCGELHGGPHRCHRRECPDCWRAWSGRRAEAIVRRIQSFRWSQEPGIGRRVVHAVASPPEGEIRSISDVRRYRQKAREKVKEKGMRGDVCILHGYRPTDETKAEFEALDGFEGGIWRYIRENDRPWRKQTYWSPHFHFIGPCRDFEADDSDDGWVVRRLSSPEPFYNLRDREAYTSLAKVATYLLSHATFESRQADDVEADRVTLKEAVTWGGELHPSNFQADREISAGSLRVIERLSSEACRAVPEAESEGEGSGPDEPEECPKDGCNGHLQSIWDARAFLQRKRNCDRIGREAERRLTVAFEWRIGDVLPPPGLKRPSTEAEMWEAFEELVDRR